jgi:hypothetical protein
METGYVSGDYRPGSVPALQQSRRVNRAWRFWVEGAIGEVNSTGGHHLDEGRYQDGIILPEVARFAMKAKD